MSGDVWLSLPDGEGSYSHVAGRGTAASKLWAVTAGPQQQRAIQAAMSIVPRWRSPAVGHWGFARILSSASLGVLQDLALLSHYANQEAEASTEVNQLAII